MSSQHPNTFLGGGWVLLLHLELQGGALLSGHGVYPSVADNFTADWSHYLPGTLVDAGILSLDQRPDEGA